MRYCLDAVEYPLGLGCYGAAFFTTAVLLILALNGTAPGLSWLAVFAPVALQGCVFVLALVVGACTRLCSALASPGGACYKQHDASRATCFYFASKAAEKALGVSGCDSSRRTGIKGFRRRVCQCLTWFFFTALVTLVLVATPVLVALRLQVWRASMSLARPSLFTCLPCMHAVPFRAPSLPGRRGR